MFIARAKFPLLLRLEKPILQDLLALFIFFYFFTLHADRLGFELLGFNFRLNNFFSILIVLCLAQYFKNTPLKIAKSFFFPLTTFLATIVIAAILSPSKGRTVPYLGFSFLTLLSYTLVPYFFIQLFSFEKVFKIYFSSFLFTGFYAFYQLVISFLGFNDPFITQNFMGIARPNAMAYEPSYYALYFSPFVSMVNVLYFFTNKAKREKISLLYLLLVNFLFLISLSTSAFFTYFIFIFFFALLFCFEKVRKQFSHLRKAIFQFCMIGLSLFFLISVTFVKLTQEVFLKFFIYGTAHHSFIERWNGIVNAWEVFKQKPFFGVGLGGVGTYLYHQWLSGNNHISSQDGRLYDPAIAFKAFEPMNFATELIASLGIIGLIAFSYLMFNFFSLANNVISSDRIDKNKKSLTISLAVSFLVMLVVLQFSQGLLRSYFWVHFSLSFSFFHQCISQQSLHKEIEDASQ